MEIRDRYMQHKVEPIWKRPLDLAVVISLLLYILTWLFFDIPTALGRPKAVRDRQFLEKVSPIWLNPPPSFRFLIRIVAFGYGPSYPILIYGLWQERPWAKKLGQILSAMLTVSTPYLMLTELTSNTPPPNKKLFFAANAPFVLGFILLAYRSFKSERGRDKG
jgi:hypothetical protein